MPLCYIGWICSQLLVELLAISALSLVEGSVPVSGMDVRKDSESTLNSWLRSNSSLCANGDRRKSNSKSVIQPGFNNPARYTTQQDVKSLC